MPAMFMGTQYYRPSNPREGPTTAWLRLSL